VAEATDDTRRAEAPERAPEQAEQPEEGGPGRAEGESSADVAKRREGEMEESGEELPG
jgi:broad specificity phosphatase PhoE